MIRQQRQLALINLGPTIFTAAKFRLHGQPVGQRQSFRVGHDRLLSCASLAIAKISAAVLNPPFPIGNAALLVLELAFLSH
jgi:hypothetical protein